MLLDHKHAELHTLESSLFCSYIIPTASAISHRWTQGNGSEKSLALASVIL